MRSMLVVAMGAGWWYRLHDGRGQYTAVFVAAPVSIPRRRSQDRDWLTSSIPAELLDTHRASSGSAVSIHAAGIQCRMPATGLNLSTHLFMNISSMVIAVGNSRRIGLATFTIELASP